MAPSSEGMNHGQSRSGNHRLAVCRPSPPPELLRPEEIEGGDPRHCFKGYGACPNCCREIRDPPFLRRLPPPARSKGYPGGRSLRGLESPPHHGRGRCPCGKTHHLRKATDRLLRGRKRGFPATDDGRGREERLRRGRGRAGKPCQVLLRGEFCLRASSSRN